MYLKFGFVQEGEEFIEADMAHIAMRLKKEDFKLPSSCGR